jgi:Ca2+-binding RTX toxin-like protein
MSSVLAPPDHDFLWDEFPGDFLAGGTYDVLYHGTQILEFDGEGEDTIFARYDFVLPDGVENLSLSHFQRVVYIMPPPASEWVKVGIGNELDNLIQGNIADNVLIGEGGDDILQGYDGNDLLVGGDAHDILGGNEGNDRLQGNEGNDNLRGGQGNDALFGGKGDDRLFGDRGNDTLSGDRGNDTMVGGSGADDFLIGPGSGLDVIADFNTAEDRLIMPKDIFWTMSVEGSDTVIRLDGAAEIRLQGFAEVGVASAQPSWIVTA